MKLFSKKIPIWVYYILSFPIGLTLIHIFRNTFSDMNLLVAFVGITTIDIIIYLVARLIMFVGRK